MNCIEMADLQENGNLPMASWPESMVCSSIHIYVYVYLLSLAQGSVFSFYHQCSTSQKIVYAVLSPNWSKKSL